LAPVKEGAVRHGPVAANVAGLIPVQRIDGDDTELQTVSAFEHLYLLSNAVGHEIKDAGLAEILGKGPVVPVPGKVSTVTVSENYMNRVPFGHTLFCIPNFLLWLDLRRPVFALYLCRLTFVAASLHESESQD
jgi:hypothetical protein